MLEDRHLLYMGLLSGRMSAK